MKNADNLTKVFKSNLFQSSARMIFISCTEMEESNFLRAIFREIPLQSWLCLDSFSYWAILTVFNMLCIIMQYYLLEFIPTYAIRFSDTLYFCSTLSFQTLRGLAHVNVWSFESSPRDPWSSMSTQWHTWKSANLLTKRLWISVHFNLSVLFWHLLARKCIFVLPKQLLLGSVQIVQAFKQTKRKVIRVIN